MAKGREPPDWYFEEPELESGDVFYITAFEKLNTCRTLGMSIGPIPWDKIVHYGEFHKLDDELIEPFIDIIMGLDALFLERQHNKPTPKSPK